ncbi:fatty acid desaturase [Alteromonas ponticola]|uniref:2Fe-2S iron-sulfur cluster binding domain-containing protein n=1 Tax=Alteromonas ponticola TaxID=2720613 RepID=A0ABX1R1S8_9ALTE|nr:fatty acid desaturase [Alteromonas ponticola]NMH59140.1 2Fe-2S iron-sulfur cluster binding domain-containing protein [Alteromonas ponticola]
MRVHRLIETRKVMALHASETQPIFEERWQQSVPAIAWGTLALFCAFIIGYASVLFAVAHALIPLTFAAVICTVLAYIGFTLVHDAGHGNIIHAASSSKWCETAIGWIAGIPLLLVPFPAFKLLHDRHHAFTNDPEQDPDHFHFGKRWYQVALNCFYIPFQYLTFMFLKLRHEPVIRATYPTTVLYFLLVFSLLGCLLYMGFLLEIVALLIVPNLIAVFVLTLFFDYLPHYPHTALDKYQNSSIFPSVWLNVLLMGQNYHLIHHLYPRVPWYRYQQVYRNVAAELRAQDAPITSLMKLSKAHETVLKVEQGEPIPAYMIMTVARIEAITPDAVKITLVLPGNKTLRFYAGQYIVLSKVLNHISVSRCYSLCNASIDECSSYLEIAVKRCTNGVFSTYLHTQLKMGDKLKVGGPFGQFGLSIYKKSAPSCMVFFAGGSGITPIISMIKRCLQHGSDVTIHLVYFSKKPTHTMFKNALLALAEQHKEKFGVTFVYSNGFDSTKEKLCYTQRLITSLVYRGYQRFFICGPRPLFDFIYKRLRKYEIAEADITSEQFSIPHTEPRGHAFNVEVIGKYARQEIRVAANQTVLEIAKQHNIVWNYACEQGHCGSCRARLIAGECTLLNPHSAALSGDKHRSGIILLCQCQPLSDLVLTHE